MVNQITIGRGKKYYTAVLAGEMRAVFTSPLFLVFGMLHWLWRVIVWGCSSWYVQTRSFPFVLLWNSADW